MNRLLPIVVLVAACVPASEARPPAGAAGFHTEPSAAARGEPMTTSDGWTLVFEKVVLQATVTVQSIEGTNNNYDYSSDLWLWDARTPQSIFTRGLSVGPWGIDVMLQTNYSVDSRNFGGGDNGPVNLGVAREDEERFRRAADAVGSNVYSTYTSGPDALFRVVGRRGAKTVVLDLSMACLLSGLAPSVARGPTQVVVREDALAVRPLRIEPERLFTEPTGIVAFDAFARADRDDDGTVTVGELEWAHVPTVVNSGEGGDQNEQARTTMKDQLLARCSGVLVRP